MPASALVSVNSFHQKHEIIADGIHLLQLLELWSNKFIESLLHISFSGKQIEGDEHSHVGG